MARHFQAMVHTSQMSTNVLSSLRPVWVGGTTQGISARQQIGWTRSSRIKIQTKRIPSRSNGESLVPRPFVFRPTQPAADYLISQSSTSPRRLGAYRLNAFSTASSIVTSRRRKQRYRWGETLNSSRRPTWCSWQKRTRPCTLNGNLIPSYSGYSR